MAWWGVVLAGLLSGAIGFMAAGCMAAGKWSDVLRQQGAKYHRQLEAARARAAKYREARLRACSRAARYRAERDVYRARAEEAERKVLEGGNMAKQYRKRPVVVEAFRLGYDDVPDWFMDEVSRGGSVLYRYTTEDGIEKTEAAIKTLEGTMLADHGDYVIKGIQGECYPCKPDIFEATYEEVSYGSATP